MTLDFEPYLFQDRVSYPQYSVNLLQFDDCSVFCQILWSSIHAPLRWFISVFRSRHT